MRQYGADLIEITWAILSAVPLDLKEGLARGPFIQPARNAATWSQRINGVGGIVRLFSPDRSGVLTLLIDMESRTHQELITTANADLVSRSITGPIVVRDGNTREISTYTKAYIVTVPDVPKGTTAGIIPWQFNFETVTQQPFGFNNNVIGG